MLGCAIFWSHVFALRSELLEHREVATHLGRFAWQNDSIKLEVSEEIGHILGTAPDDETHRYELL
jgi:hypothetical protein